jgi:hypothetical protein
LLRKLVAERAVEECTRRIEGDAGRMRSVEVAGRPPAQTVFDRIDRC